MHALFWLFVLGIGQPHQQQLANTASTTATDPANCSSAFDCSYNGVCNTATRGCQCRAAWKGPYCETLAIKPGRKILGYQGTTTGASAAATTDTAGVAATNASGPSVVRRLSSWGGAPLRDDAGVYHLITSEIINNAGMLPWGCNSHIIHATSADPLTQPFVKRRVLWPVFSYVLHAQCGVPAPPAKSSTVQKKTKI